MRKFLLRAGVCLAIGTLISLWACESSERQATPGELPSAKTDVTPKLNASTYVAHGHLLEQQGNLEQAVTQYRQALELVPNLVAARNRLGITLNKLERHSEASEEFRQSIARNPKAAHLHNNLGFSLYLEGNYKEAEGALADAVALQPGFRRAQMNHGLVLARLGRYDEALAAFSVAGSQADAHFNLGMMQAEDGRYADAARSLERALQLNPELAAARQQLREIARLAAAEEQAHAAAMAEAEEARAAAAEAARLAAAEAAEAIEAAAESAVEDVRMTADCEQEPDDVPMGDPESVPAEPVWDCAELMVKIETLVAMASANPALAVLGDLDGGELVALFDRLVEAAVSDAPWYEETLCQLQGMLDSTE